MTPIAEEILLDPALAVEAPGTICWHELAGLQERRFKNLATEVSRSLM